MNGIRKKGSTCLFVVIAMVSTLLPSLSFADDIYSSRSGRYSSEPSAAEMVGDAVIGRPALLVSTTVGLAIFTVTSPFSLLGGNFIDAFDKLVADPAKATFFRCLGCTEYNQTGYQRR